MTTQTTPIMVLAAPALAATILLLARLFLIHGRAFFFRLLVWGLLFFWMKEALQANGLFLNHDYSFPPNAPLALGPVPLVIIVGHFFTFALSYSLACRILKNLKLPQAIPFLTVGVFVVTMTIAYMVEVGGTQAGWWWWGDGQTPWWEDPRLQWMGRIHFGVVQFDRHSLGDVPCCLLAGWPIGVTCFFAPLMLEKAYKDSRPAILRFAGYALVFPFMLLVGWWNPAITILLVFLLLQGFRRGAPNPVFPEAGAARFFGIKQWVARFGDYAAFFIFLLVMVFVEARAGFQAEFAASWIPMLFYVGMAAWPGRAGVCMLAGAACAAAAVGWVVGVPSLWLGPFQIIYMGVCLFLFSLAVWAVARKRADVSVDHQG